MRLKEILQQIGHEVTLCTDDTHIDENIKNISHYDIVFTDMELQHATGKDILAHIKKSHAEIPVWLMTAYDDYTEEKALSEGFSGFITKPVDIEKLVEILSKNKKREPSPTPLTTHFPLLVSLFDGDEKAIREILATFVKTTYEDIEKLEQQIEENNFEGAQQICHKMHPFLAQLNAEYLCSVLRKMDRLRGENEAAFPQWKEELAMTIKELRTFADKIYTDYL